MKDGIEAQQQKGCEYKFLGVFAEIIAPHKLLRALGPALKYHQS